MGIVARNSQKLFKFKSGKPAKCLNFGIAGFVGIVGIVEFFTVLLVFLPESGGIRSIPGILRNRILAVVPAKIGISVPQNSGGFRNGHRITRTESTETESAEFFFQ